FGQRFERGVHGVGMRVHVAGVVVVVPDLVDLRCAYAHFGARPVDVVQVLPAGRVRAVRAGDERERPLYPVVAHGRDRVGEPRVPRGPGSRCAGTAARRQAPPDPRTTPAGTRRTPWEPSWQSSCQRTVTVTRTGSAGPRPGPGSHLSGPLR